MAKHRARVPAPGKGKCPPNHNQVRREALSKDAEARARSSKGGAAEVKAKKAAQAKASKKAAESKAAKKAAESKEGSS